MKEAKWPYQWSPTLTDAIWLFNCYKVYSWMQPSISKWRLKTYPFSSCNLVTSDKERLKIFWASKQVAMLNSLHVCVSETDKRDVVVLYFSIWPDSESSTVSYYAYILFSNNYLSVKKTGVPITYIPTLTPTKHCISPCKRRSKLSNDTTVQIKDHGL